MKTIYAIQFDIYSPNSDTQSTLLATEKIITAWVERKYKRTWATEVSLEFHDTIISPLPQHAIVTSVQESDDFRYSQLEWIHPDDQDKSLLWKTLLNLCADKEKVEISIVVRIESAQFMVKPVTSYTFGRPGIVDDILANFECSIFGETIPKQHSIISKGDNVAQFLNDVLENPNRTLPVVMMSQDVWTDRYFVDPEVLQKKLLGYAKVVLIEKYAGFELSGLVGKQLSCYNGAIRVYWAGFNKSSNPYSHQLFLQEKMIEFKNQGSYIETHLFRLLASVASLRYSEGSLSKKAMVSFQNKRANEIARIRKELQDNTLGVGEIEKELEKSWDENEKLHRELSENRVRIQELEIEIATHRENYRNLIEYQETSSLEKQEKVEPTEFDSVLTALTEADSYFNKRSLIVWDSALESAEKSNFARPKEVFDALKTIAELGDKYFETLKTGKSMGSWENFFAEHGLKYAPTESEMTINLYGNERIQSHQNEKKQMLRHVTIGGGDRTNCIQIYFEPDDIKQKIEVGYCGMHLSYYNQRT